MEITALDDDEDDDYATTLGSDSEIPPIPAPRTDASGSPPDLVPELDADHYHTFLSHVWGTGQDQMRVVKTRLREMLPLLQVFLE